MTLRTASPSDSPNAYNLPPDVYADWESLTNEEAEELLFTWPIWARPSQLAPTGSWRTWLILAGRGWGKTRVGAEYVRAQVEAGNAGRIALVGATAADARDVMIEGESGLLAVCPPWNKPIYEPSKRRVTWPNGAMATAYSADQPDRLRGPQHDLAWADELAAWRYIDAWDMLMMGLRLGQDPRVAVTTTPRPTEIIRDLLKADTTAATRGSTYENAHNLAPAFLQQILARYEGTRLGRQELNAEILDDTPGALWTHGMIEALRVAHAPELKRIIVAVDPAVTSGEKSDETGIIIAGIGIDDRGYILEDISMRASPNEWASAVVSAYGEYSADRVIAEVNNGGDLVEATLRTVDKRIPYTAVRASRGKRVRAEPVAALYEQGKVSHVGGFAQLEDQMTSYTPDTKDSPDRMDALVWALTHLMLIPKATLRPQRSTVRRGSR